MKNLIISKMFKIYTFSAKMSQINGKIKCDVIGSSGPSHRPSQDFGSGENTFRVGLLGGPGGSAPRTPHNFLKFS